MAETQQVTVLFTDLVGSTALTARLDPAEADHLRETHFALLRSALEEHGGTEVKNLGDGLMVVFSITSGALNGAEAMQQAIARHNTRAAEPLSIRVGLSHGEVTEDMGDYFGDAVVEAARLCARADGGQILATQLVQLNAGRRARQEFVPVGELELKGLPDPVATVEVRWSAIVQSAGDGLIPLPARCASTTAAGFVGRESERALLDEALKAVGSDGAHRLVLIGGEPGMGKTTLATECARAAHCDGAIVLFGRANEELAVPYGPWAEALVHLVSQASGELLEILTPLVRPLTRLAPTLANGLVDTEGPSTSDPEAARYILFSAVANVLRAAGGLAPVVLVLDDLQWADEPSLQLLRHVAMSDPMRALVIGTFRESDVAAGHPLADLLGALHREQGTERVALRGLDDLELVSMMERVGGQALDEDGLALRDALIAETDGNPFFVGELLRHLVETGGIRQEHGRWVASADLREKGLPVSVREVIGRRVGQLGEVASRVLTVAAVIGRDFELSLLATASELDEDTLLDVLDQAMESTLVDNVEGNRYTFVHALIEHTLYDSLAPARRVRLHRRVAEAVEAQSRGRLEGRAAELAYHWTQAAVPDDLEKAVVYGRMAGDEALARLAPAEAMRWYTQTLSLIEHRAGTELLRCGILVGLGDAQRQSGNPAHRETLLEAAQLAQELDDTELLVAAVLANHRGFFSSADVVDAGRVQVLEAACAALEGAGTADQARVLAQLASELTLGDDFPRRKRLAEQALAIVRSLEDPEALASVACLCMLAINVPETLDECVALMDEASEITRTLGDPILRFWCELGHMIVLYQTGDVTRVDGIFAELWEIAARLGWPVLRWAVGFMDASRKTLAGELEEAEHAVMEAFEIGTSSGQPDALSFFGSQLYGIRVMQGRSAEMLELFTQMIETNPAYSVSLAGLYLETGRPDEARSILAPRAANGFSSISKNFVWLYTACGAAAVVARLDWPQAAQGLFDQLLPYAEQIPFVGSNNAPQVSLYLGMLAVTLSRHDEAEAFYAQAAETHERIGAVWGSAMTELKWGQSLVARGDAASAASAVPHFEQALTMAQGRGFGAIEIEAREALDTLRRI